MTRVPQPRARSSRGAASRSRLGEYALVEELGSGGMASVHAGFRAAAHGFAAVVAIKRLHPHLASDVDLVRALIDEARVVAALRHRAIVHVLDVVDAGDEVGLVLELVEGLPASRLLSEGGPLPLALGARIVVDALEALETAHRATDLGGRPLALVHRDVSPHNLLVGADGSVRLTDFGVAKAALRAANTEEGQRKGKLLYMAPEQLAGSAVDARADLFALGATAFELWTGTRPFSARTSDRAASPSIDAASLEALSGGIVAGPLAEILASAMATDRDARPASADELREAIVACVAPAEPGALGRYVEAAAPRALDRAREAVRATEAAAYEHVATVSTWGAGEGVSRSAQRAPLRAEPGRSGRGPGWGTTLAAIGLGGLGVAWGITRYPPSSEGPIDSAARVEDGAQPAVSAPPPVPPPATSPEPAIGSSKPAPSAATPASTTPSGSVHADARPSFRSALAPPKPSAATSTPVSTATTPDRCQPPYVVDASGVRTYKPECL